MRLLPGILIGALLSVTTPAGAQELRVGGGERPLFELATTPVGPLVLPADVAVGSNGRIYVVDGGNHRVVAFDSSGKFLFTIGRRGAGPGELRDPVGIATDSRGRVYVADKGNGRVQVFDAAGALERAIPVVDVNGPARPIGVVVSERGERIYVTGNMNHNVMVFDADGKLMREWGAEGVATGQFRYPASMALHDGMLYVVDGLNSRVQIFTEAGLFQYQVGEWGVLPGQLFRPKGIALDGKGRIYVSDGYMDVVQVYDTDYRLLYVFGAGGELRRFKAPGGMAIDPATNRLYVVEMLENRVSVFQLD